jgi:hypothetical protein
MSENVGASTSRNPKGLHGLYGDLLLLLLLYIKKSVISKTRELFWEHREGPTKYAHNFTEVIHEHFQSSTEM